MDLGKILYNHKLWLDGEGGERADLSSVDLRDAKLVDADLRGADLMDANLRCANLSGANLTRSDLMDANLMGANLTRARLLGANLRGADIMRAELWCANLSGADLRRANLTGTKFPDTDMVLSSPWGHCHIQRDHIRIGCKYHTTKEWDSFSDEEIARMDEGTLTWWKQWKPAVMFLAQQCKPYGEAE